MLASPRRQRAAPGDRGSELAAGLLDADEDAAKIAKIESTLAIAGAERETGVALVAALMAVDAGERYSLPMLEPRVRREKTLALLVEHFLGLANDAPLLCVVEDMHWIDPTTLDLLTRLVAHAPGHPLLLVASARPEFDVPWRDNDHVVDIRSRASTRMS